MEQFYEIDTAVELLEAGKILLYPTDTIWGIGCDATNVIAIERINTLKKRTADKSFVLLVSSVEMLKRYVGPVHPRIETLLAFHERPLTIIYGSANDLPEEVKADNGSVAIRVVKDAFCKNLIEKMDKPIVSTSANVTGAPFPEHFGKISSEIIGGVDYVVRHRRKDMTQSEPSVIAILNANEELDIIRE